MFTINGQEWYIKFVPPYDEIFRINNREFTIGVCDGEERIIYIANNLRGYLLKKVLCHEIVHAAMFSYDVWLNYEQEELLADLIATYGEEIIYITNKIFKKLQ